MRVIHVLRKPLSEGTVAKNVLKHGTGGLNIDRSRVAYLSDADMTPSVGKGAPGQLNPGSGANFPHHKENWGEWTVNQNGRWPANVILQHLPDCAGSCTSDCPVAALNGQSGERPVSGAAQSGKPATAQDKGFIGPGGGLHGNGTLHNDTGGASRFFKQVGGQKD